MATDPTIRDWEFDVETDRKAREKLADMGINKPEDLQPGRLDIQEVTRALGGVDPEVSPLAAEKAMRNAEMAAQVIGDEQPTIREATPEAPAAAPATDRLAQLQAEATAAKTEADDWKRKYGERENRLGDERRRTAERLARLELGGSVQPQQPQPFNQPQQPPSYDPRILGDRDPNVPLTAAETASLMQSMAAAFGSQMRAREAGLLDATRQMRNYDLTADEEVTLIERHPWLANIDRAAQLKAMGDLVKPLRIATNVVAPQPQPVPTASDK